ncbi:hypothetical protein DMC61_14490 [Amycolatopsis sp. WAC 04169]|uniref:hypothetical protein n=1 Tax=Amycolatopsis sp. WAC 04169 TaxID=2203197 RepID=UPI000F7A1963|nr:hypothetical protein [Amycolatopsis sp. WAC 04169]RSN31354.1 hypothetical protein DMC61_14490 [Amycolatopsis sp. WAC 04169]
MDQAERQALTMICAQLTELRTECALQPEPRQRLLAQIETEASARRPIVDLLSQLQGTSGEETRQMLSGGLPGLSPGQADEESFRCPDAACDRVGTTLPAGPIPRCQLTGQPMTRW